MRGPLALLILPKFGLLTLATGDPKFAWLKTLKNSPRTCSVTRSVTGKPLNTE